MTEKKNNIAILLGGTSTERAVSKQSGKAMYEAIENLGYNVKLIDPAYGLNQPEKTEDYFSDCDCSVINNNNYIKAINSDFFNNIDLVVIALHGKWGEDGTIQSLLELRGIKYTGSSVLGSALSMDKVRSKIMFNHFNVPTPEWIEVTKENTLEEIHSTIESKFGYPCIIKPNDQGSTIGLTKCNSKNELNTALAKALQFSKKVIIEKFIAGREIAVGIVDNKILPILEIIPEHELYDYECKYKDGMAKFIVPAEISNNLKTELEKQTRIAFDSLGCKGYGRVDFRIDKYNKPYCLEVNTLPGMTSHSLVPKMAKAMGMEFDELINKIIDSVL